MSCLDANLIAQYFDLELKPAETDRLFSHIDSCPACAQLFMDTVVARKQSTDVNPDGDTAPGKGAAPALESKLGRYEIDRILGMGGMGVVYAGRDPDLDRKVAIKLLRPDPRISAATLRARLTREAQAMARLSHPNVINVYEIGTWGEQVFVVMELIDGATLAEWLRERQRDWREIVHAFIAAGDGLSAAHKAGLVHRDFKPDNVLMSRDGRVCVTDFGLARIGKEDGDPEGTSPSTFAATLTYSGLLVGTPAYMAPEQMRGDATDARSDVFSFCVSLYEALYGVRPYAGQNLDELREATEAGRLQPPRRIVGPSAHKKIIERGLEPNAGKRPASMAELLAVLRVDPARLRRIVGSYAAVVLLATVAALVWVRAERRSRLCTAGDLAGAWDAPVQQRLRDAFAKSGQPGAALVERALDDYRRDWLAMRVSACEATRLRGEQSEELLDLRMQCLDDRKVELRALTTALSAADSRVVEKADRAVSALAPLADCADGAMLRARTPLPGDPAVRARVGTLKDTLARAKALYYIDDKTEESLALATQVSEDPAAQAYPPLRAEALLIRGIDLPWLDRLDEAVPLYKQAAELGIQSHADEIPARAWIGLAEAAGNHHRHLAEALDWDRLAEAMITRLGRDDLEIARLASLIRIYKASELTAKAEEYARLYLRRVETHYPAGDRHLAFALDMLANCVADLGHSAEAEPLYRRALAILAENGLSESVSAANMLINLGILTSEQHRFAEAEANARLALALRQKLLPPHHFLIGEAQLNLSDALSKLHRWNEVGPLLDGLQEVVDRHPQEASDLGTQIPWLRGEMKIGQGHIDEGIALLERALADPELRPMNRGQVEFDLARVSRRKQSLAYAEAAKISLGRELPGDPILVQEIDRWLAGHQR